MDVSDDSRFAVVVSGVSFDAVVLLVAVLFVMVVSALDVVDEVSGPFVVWLVSVLEPRVVSVSLNVVA